MGLGKTIIALSALTRLGVDRALIFAPARVAALDVWGHEAKLWEHTQHVNIVPVVGPPKKRLEILTAFRYGPTFFVISYDLMHWLTRFPIGKVDAVVFDELSKMKAPGTKRFKAARHWLKGVPIRMGLTGTPVGNHLMDLWGEMFMVAGADALGPTFTQFKQRYFYSPDLKGWTWIPFKGTQKAIEKRIKPYAFTIDESLAPTKTPQVKVNEIEVPLPAMVLEQQRTLVKELQVELSKGKTLAVLSATSLAGKLRQFASGAVYVAENQWEEVHEEKMKALQELLDEQQGDPVLLFYHYKHELLRLLKRFPQSKLLGSRRDAEYCSQEDWNKKRVELMVAHPQSVGFGLNLQHGGSTICWYTLPWSLELWEQATARLARQGQPAPYVTSHVLLAGKVDRMVLKVLRNKGKIQSDVLEALND